MDNQFAAYDEDQSATTFVQANAREIDERLRVDYEFFAEFFLSDQLTMGIPEFHYQTWERMVDPERDKVLEAIPREHAKTTQAKLAVVWHFMFSERRFCVYLSNTNTIALNACKDIFALFSHPNYVATYGNVDIQTSSEGNSLWIFTITQQNGKKKKCILRAMGANQQMRGLNIDHQRPDLAIVDDVEDLDNTSSEILQKKLDTWIFATFLKALKKNHKIIWIGNMLRKTSLLARLSSMPEFKDKWNALVLGALIRDPETGELRPLWPELWSLEKLQEDFLAYQVIGQTQTWFCEMMNMPGQGESGIQAEEIKYVQTQNPEDYLATFLTIDPAFGLNPDVNDKTAIVLHGIPKEGIPHVISYKVGHMTETEIFNHCMRFMRYWKCWSWGIERVAAQKVLLTLFELLLVKAQESRVQLYALQPSTRESKGMRIRTFVNFMKDDQYALPLGDLDATTQFLNYDFTMKEQEDDLIDGISYGPDMLIQHKNAIIGNARRALSQEDKLGALLEKIKTSSEVASV